MNEQNVFLISDLHLFHKNIIEFEERPFNNVYDMHETIIKNWNNRVTNNDKVFILGDLTFGKKEPSKAIVERLNGKLYLIKGNHDNKSNQWYRDIGIDEISEFPTLIHDYYLLSHEPMLYLKDPMINCFGHVHNSPNFPTFTTHSVCVCAERWNYTPVSLFSITHNILKLRKIIEETQLKFNWV